MKTLFIDTNIRTVVIPPEAAFEHVWMSRDTHVDRVPGFVEFHLLKGPAVEDHTLFGSG